MAEVEVERDEDAAMDDGAAPKRGGKGKGVKTKGRGHDAAKTDGDRYEGRGGVFEVRAASRCGGLHCAILGAVAVPRSVCCRCACAS